MRCGSVTYSTARWRVRGSRAGRSAGARVRLRVVVAVSPRRRLRRRRMTVPDRRRPPGHPARAARERGDLGCVEESRVRDVETKTSGSRPRLTAVTGPRRIPAPGSGLGAGSASARRRARPRLSDASSGSPPGQLHVRALQGLRQPSAPAPAGSSRRRPPGRLAGRQLDVGALEGLLRRLGCRYLRPPRGAKPSASVFSGRSRVSLLSSAITGALPAGRHPRVTRRNLRRCRTCGAANSLGLRPAPGSARGAFVAPKSSADAVRGAAADASTAHYRTIPCDRLPRHARSVRRRRRAASDQRRDAIIRGMPRPAHPPDRLRRLADHRRRHRLVGGVPADPRAPAPAGRPRCDARLRLQHPRAVPREPRVVAGALFGFPNPILGLSGWIAPIVVGCRHPRRRALRPLVLVAVRGSGCSRARLRDLADQRRASSCSAPCARGAW